MWTGDLPCQLSWMRMGKLKRNRFLPQIPSWSWASTVGLIEPFKQSWCVPDWQDACSFISVDNSDVLTLSGRLKVENRFTFESLAGKFPEYDPSGWESSLDFGLDDLCIPDRPDPWEIDLIMDEFNNTLGWVVLDGIYPRNGCIHYFLIGEEKEVSYIPECNDMNRLCRILVLQTSSSHILALVRIGVGVMRRKMYTWFNSVQEQYVCIV